MYSIRRKPVTVYTSNTTYQPGRGHVNVWEFPYLASTKPDSAGTRVHGIQLQFRWGITLPDPRWWREREWGHQARRVLPVLIAVLHLIQGYLFPGCYLNFGTHNSSFPHFLKLLVVKQCTLGVSICLAY